MTSATRKLNLFEDLFNSKFYHVFVIKITRNSTILQEITTFFDIPDSISTVIGYVQPCFEPWTGQFSHYTNHICHIYRILPNKGAGRSSKVIADNLETKLRF